MVTEVFMLVLTVLLLFVLVLAKSMFLMPMNKISYFFGTRDEPPNTNIQVKRVERTIDNHKEGLLLFAPIILIGAVTDGFNSTTALAAQIFFGARVLHALCYMWGIVYMRSLFWVVGILAWLTILVQVAF